MTQGLHIELLSYDYSSLDDYNFGFSYKIEKEKTPRYELFISKRFIPNTP